jgi:hypothetical protein
MANGVLFCEELQTGFDEHPLKIHGYIFAKALICATAQRPKPNKS